MKFKRYWHTYPNGERVNLEIDESGSIWFGWITMPFSTKEETNFRTQLHSQTKLENEIKS